MNYLKLAMQKGASYAETLSTRITSTLIESNNKQIKELSSGETGIYAVRALYKGAWGLAYSSKPDFKGMVTSAIRNAKSIRQDIRIKYAEPTKMLIDAKYADNPLDIDIEDKKAMLLSLDDRRRYKKISSLTLNYADRTAENRLENTEGSSTTTSSVRTALFSTAYAKQGSKMEQFTSILRKRAGYELMEKAQQTAQESMKKAEMMLSAKYAEGGTFPTIIDQHLAGVFAHEAIGHACEADLVLTGSSILAGKIGHKVGNETVTIFDDGGADAWGYTPVDSEGIKSHHTVLINKGMLQAYMHNRETAAISKAEPTGNGRSQDPSRRVIPRMTNTAIAEGDSSFEEMLSEVKKGYYLKGSSGGQVDTAGGDFLFNAREGYLIENHKIKHMIKGVSLLGSILETLHNIRLAARDTDYDTGFCGKADQAVPVACGAPHVLLDKAKIGGAR